MINPTDMELLEKYVDGTLAEDEFIRLESLLRVSAEARAKLRTLATIEFGLQDFAEDRDEMLIPAARNPIATNAAPTLSPWPLALAIAAAVLLIAGIYAVRFNYPQDVGSPTIARVSGIDGSVNWMSDGGRMKNDLQTGMSLTGGTIQGMTPGSWIELEFNDGSSVVISGESLLTFSDFGQKELHLHEGSISADVNPQPPGQPMLVHTQNALLKVVGTRFEVETELATTALDVNEGEVSVRRRSDGQTIDVPANHRVVATIDKEMALERIPDSVRHWKSQFAGGPMGSSGKWSPRTDEKEASISPLPYLYTSPTGQTMSVYSASLQISGGDSPPVTLAPDSRIRVRGRCESAVNASFGVVVRHPDGGFGGNFLAYAPGLQVDDGQQEFDIVIKANELVLTRTLESIKDELVADPIDVVVETFWCATIVNPAGLEIFEVEFLPPDSSRR